MQESERQKSEAAGGVNVGQRVRTLRHQRGYSLRALAEQSGLNINTLSLIEKGKNSPSVSTLQHLAQALKVPMTAFFEEEIQKKKVSHLRKVDQKTTFINGTRLANLAKELCCTEIQPFFVSLDPGAGSGPVPIVHTGCEFVYCLKGRALYTIEGNSYLLEEGDSLIFEAYQQHSWENAQDDPTQLLLLMVPSEPQESVGSRHFER